MATWKYRYKLLTGVEIRESFLEILDGDDRIVVIERIQKLRIELNSKGFQFIDAAPVDGAEKVIGQKLSGLKRFMKPPRLSPSRRFSSLWIISLILCVLLLLLAIL